MSVEVVNFGCRLNIAEGEAVRAAAAGIGPATIINSCAVTAEASRQTRQAIRRAHTRRPGARIIVTGCAADVERPMLDAMPEIDAIVPNALKRVADAYHGRPTTPLPFTPVVSGAGHARAFVEVQTGCDHACTFCIITHARGASRSAAPDAVIDAVASAVARGHGEVVLTGVDMTSYTGGLGTLVATILSRVPELPRLRLSSLDPMAIDPLLERLIATEPRIMPSLHLSVQAGDDLILKRMRRRHLRADVVALVARLTAARPELVIGADLIAGFPTEDEAMAERSLALIDACRIVHAHVFPYSPRPGTPAARMPQVAPAIVRARAAALRARAAARRDAWLATLVGTTQAVLVERDGQSGHSPQFARVRFAAQPPGAIVPIRIVAVDDAVLQGVAA